MEGIEPRTQNTCRIVRVVTANEKSLINRDTSSFERLSESCPDPYTLQKCAAYLTVFKEFAITKAKKVAFKRPVVDASYLDKAFKAMVIFMIISQENLLFEVFFNFKG